MVAGVEAADDRLIYILEKGHVPAEHGEIDCATDPREPLASQAKAFVESYRRQPGKPQAKAATVSMQSSSVAE
jgi:hypothetical protein